ncbi:SDR family oxidoreductase [Polyangium mundeleinium]|uniref:SDR family oxidoreductase n=1 Tax=Polyangium mundeleinium TaxID=2995306 RepID=A0ABT5F6F3_9BACT|nr:SDR family oxidoreductase [Polyangium mundeleinium]MDC0749693.1 SDR family oxidoreductase [Polyangium mundeleinium]
MGALEGKVAVVTGGSTGIGFAAAKRFASEGARVFITGRRQAELDAAVAAIGSSAIGVRADSSNLADLDRLYDVVREQAGRIDVVFANAGGGEFLPLGAITEEHYDRTFNTNVKGVLFTVQKALPLLVDGGSIILNASTTSTMGTESFSVYSATKAAVRNFARSWILDLKARRIRVNVISPGPIKTPGLASLAPTEEQAKALLQGLATTIPLGRLGDPDEVGKAAVFLASDASSFVNGAELFVDGGYAQI